jgi:hypothetical protein
MNQYTICGSVFVITSAEIKLFQILNGVNNFWYNINYHNAINYIMFNL